MSLPPRPGFADGREERLAGREELLARLDDRLNGGHETGPRVVALYGLAGAGKTSVAVEYAYRHLAEVEVAWYFRAEDTTVLEAGFSALAAQLGAREVVDARDPVKSVHAVLAAYPADWLLIFHNAPDRETMAGFLPPAGRGRVVITSGYPFWSPGQALEVPALDTGAAAAFLLRRTGESDLGAARALAAELGGLPLALERAGAYIQASGDSLAGYLALFRRRRADMLARGAPTGDKKTVATVWTLAFEDLRLREPDAAGLLRLLAYCAPEAIPHRVLLQPRPGLGDDQFGPEVAPVLVPLLDEVAARDAIAALRQYSLVIHAGDGLVSVHRLVQAVTADQMPAELAGQWRRAAAALVEAAIPADTQLPAAWRICAVLLPHARVLLDVTSSGMWRIAQYLAHSGSYPAARDLFQLITRAYGNDDAYGPEHPKTLAARSNLALNTGEAGDAAGARDQYVVLLPIQDRVLGPEHPDTLATRGHLASFTGEAGDVAGARDQFAALLPVEVRVLGADHPRTLTTRHDLAFWTGKAGDAAAARDQFAALLPVEVRVLGADHPRTLITRSHLAWSTQEAGDAAGARDEYAALLPITERVLGREHPRSLMTRHDLACSTAEAGDAAGACDQLAALLPAYERVLGPEHPLTLLARHDLAWCTGKAGNAAGARDQHAALLPVREQVLGREHPDTLTTRSNLAYWTGQAGDAGAARNLAAELLPIRELVSGPDHPDTLAERYQLARWTGEAGDPAAARDLFAELLPVRVRVLGPDHPDSLATRHQLARSTAEAGDPAAARDQLAELLPMLNRILGPEHPDTLTVRDDLAHWTESANDGPSTS